MSSRGLQERTGLPVWLLAALAALGLPRVVAHDLDLAGGAVLVLLNVAPPIAWLAVVVGSRSARPFAALLAVGALYGLVLAVTHQALWTEAFGGDPPRLGENLADAPDWFHAVATRTGAFAGSLAVGVALGAVLGAVATLAHRRAHAPRRTTGAQPPEGTR